MPTYIAKFEHEGTAYYLEWSTIVDAPITFGMTLDEFKQYYRKKYGEQPAIDLSKRLNRVDLRGCSSEIPHHNLAFLIRTNRAGKDETRLTKKEIIHWYCLQRKTPE